MTYKDYLAHHGIKKMKWGKRNGPPYPLTDSQRTAAQNAANPTSASARMLAKRGDNNRFVKSNTKIYGQKEGKTNRLSVSDAAKDTNLRRSSGGGGGGSGLQSKSLEKTKQEGENGTTHEDVTKHRLSKFASKYGYTGNRVNYSEEAEEKKKKSSGLTEAEKAAKRAQQEADRQARLKRQAERDKEHAEDRAYKLQERARKESEREQKAEEKAKKAAEKEASDKAKAEEKAKKAAEKEASDKEKAEEKAKKAAEKEASDKAKAEEKAKKAAEKEASDKAKAEEKAKKAAEKEASDKVKAAEREKRQREHDEDREYKLKERARKEEERLQKEAAKSSGSSGSSRSSGGGSSSSASGSKKSVKEVVDKGLTKLESDEKDEKDIEKSTEKALKIIDRIFDGSMSERSIDSLLDDLDKALFDGEEDDKSTTKGQNYYKKLLAKFSGDDDLSKATKEKIEKIIKERNEEDAKQGEEEYEKLKKQLDADFKDGSIDRLSRSISAIADHVMQKAKENPTAINRAKAKVLSYLEDKLSWYNENRSNSTDKEANLKDKRNYQKVASWLRRKGF